MTPARDNRTASHGAAEPAPERMVYVFRAGWADVLAGGDPRWLNRDGDPALTLISVAAGLDRSTLTQIKNGAKGIGPLAMGALVGFMIEHHGYTRERAEAELFDHVPLSEARAREAVAA